MNQGHTAAAAAPELPRLPLNSVAVASSLGATSDIDAARLFLEHVGARNERTRREYEREIGRLLLYLDVRRRSLTDTTYVDLKDYLETLADEQRLQQLADARSTAEARAVIERAFSIGAHRVMYRGTPQPITGKRAANARPILASFLRWLAEAGYRPPIAVPRLATTGNFNDRIEAARSSVARRKLDQHLWTTVDQAIDALSWQTREQVTVRSLLIWLRWSGVRRDELANARNDDLIGPVTGKDGRVCHFWMVRGKGGRVRWVPLNEAMIQAYCQYLNTMGYLVQNKDFTSLHGRALFELPRWTRYGMAHLAVRPVTGVDVYEAVRTLAKAAAEKATNAMDRQRLGQVTPHWFRHRRAFELEQQTSLAIAAQFLGHASVTTTQIYSSAADFDLAAAVYPAAVQPPMRNRAA